jgi:FKBP-type peptidyl-prolyl cis-trans isomerase (trigger factor)
MKSEVKRINESNVEILIEADGESVKNKFEDVFVRIGKEAKVKGFRPGHVPRDIIEKQFSSHAQEQVLKEMVPDLYSQVIEKEKIEAIEMPQITDIKIERTALSFKAVVELSPEITVKDYKGLTIEYQNISVEADEVKRNIDSLKEMRKADAIDDNFAKMLGYPSLDELKKVVQWQLGMQKENLQRQKIENQVIEQITKGLDFKLPRSMVAKQLDHLLRQAKIDLALKGVIKEKIAEKESTLVQELEPEANRQVRIYLILSSIAKKENIPADDSLPQKVMELLFKEAVWKEKK